VCRLLLMLRNTTDVFRKTMNFDVLANGRSIKVGVELSDTIAIDTSYWYDNDPI
jgi:hypothetical protein